VAVSPTRQMAAALGGARVSTARLDQLAGRWAFLEHYVGVQPVGRQSR